MASKDLYLNSAPATDLEILEVPQVPTAVVFFTDYHMSEMDVAFDQTFHALIPTLAQRGISPQGPGFALHHRMPTDTVTFEVGISVDHVLAEEVSEQHVTVMPSTIPAGKVARISHIGAYDGLPQAWHGFMEAIEQSGQTPAFPLWEVYVTEPTPDIDPATLRTDLYILLQS